MKPFIHDCAEIYPQPYIQNRRNWCWAVACKILGQQYKYRHPQWNFSIVYDSQDLTDLLQEHLSGDGYSKSKVMFTMNKAALHLHSREVFFTESLSAKSISGGDSI